MITALVQFKLPVSVTRDKAQEIFADIAPQFCNLPGLLQKYFLLSEDGSMAGGVYLWESRKDAERFYTKGFRQSIVDEYGSEPSITYFESPVVVNNLSSGRKEMMDQELALIATSEPSSQASKPNFVSWLSNVWTMFVEDLIQANQLKIKLIKNKTGENCWIINVPGTGRTAIFHSEQEVQVWLDERYYDKTVGVAGFPRMPISRF